MYYSVINTEILGTTLSFPGIIVPKLGSEHEMIDFPRITTG